VEPTEENLSKWFDAGVVCVGMGSQLFKKSWIQERQFEELEHKIREALGIINHIKNA
jgi:2-dehydro-3-deoxyphosphogluconate aldolase/(4S)-4-hydroxy-2-oxoglutarate aldolase